MQFQSVEFDYFGEKKFVRPSSVLRLIALVEQLLTPELLNAKINPAAGVAVLQAELLRFAGFADVDELKLAIYFKKNQDQSLAVIEKCLALLALLSPPDDLAEKETGAKKPEPLAESSRDFTS